jgi:hypothetical protein
MITKLIYSDYLKIKDTFSEDEIKEKYGKIKVMSEKEYKIEKLSEKNKKR